MLGQYPPFVYFAIYTVVFHHVFIYWYCFVRHAVIYTLYDYQSQDYKSQYYDGQSNIRQCSIYLLRSFMYSSPAGDATKPLSLNKTVFLGSAIISILLIIWTIAFPDYSQDLLSAGMAWVSESFGW